LRAIAASRFRVAVLAQTLLAVDAADVVAWLKVLGRGDVDHIANLIATGDPSMLLVAVGCFLLPNLPYGMAMAAGPARIEAPRATAPISCGSAPWLTSGFRARRHRRSGDSGCPIRAHSAERRAGGWVRASHAGSEL
jgi:hypothetical protein